MTASERQRIEKERNRRARIAIKALTDLNSIDWSKHPKMYLITTIRVISDWAIDPSRIDKYGKSSDLAMNILHRYRP